MPFHYAQTFFLMIYVERRGYEKKKEIIRGIDPKPPKKEREKDKDRMLFFSFCLLSTPKAVTLRELKLELKSQGVLFAEAPCFNVLLGFMTGNKESISSLSLFSLEALHKCSELLGEVLLFLLV